MIDLARIGRVATAPGVARQKGFTLIELMIAVAILAIVMGIAIPSYTQWVLESGRADGKAELFRVAQQLERCFTRYSSYTDDDCDVAASYESEKGKYRVDVDAAATEFSLTATAIGGQTSDDDCPTMTLDHRGVRGPEDTREECW
jgi:type IV pilus assembly protein PilE